MIYGVPYQGSKGKLAGEITGILPAAPVLYDVFAGGCAVTHAALLSGKWAEVRANDLDGRGLRLFAMAAEGLCRDEARWITKEDFGALKETDELVAICWSYGNCLGRYRYGDRLGEYKRLLHRLFHAPTPGERLALFGEAVRWMLENERETLLHGTPGKRQRLHRLQSLENKHRLDLLEGLDISRLTSTFLDYRELRFAPGSVVYCDPPYKGCNDYWGRAFGHEEFHEWALGQEELTVISEYAMPEGFREVWSKGRPALDGESFRNHGTERLFVPERQLGLWERMGGRIGG